MSSSLVIATHIAKDASNTLSETDTRVIERIYTQFSDAVHATFGSDASAPLAWVQLVGEMMGALQSFNASGSKKKEILMAVLRQVIDKEIEPQYRPGAKVLLDTVISPSIDMAAVYRHNIQTWFQRTCRCC